MDIALPRRGLFDKCVQYSGSSGPPYLALLTPYRYFNILKFVLSLNSRATLDQTAEYHKLRDIQWLFVFPLLYDPSWQSALALLFFFLRSFSNVRKKGATLIFCWKKSPKQFPAKAPWRFTLRKKKLLKIMKLWKKYCDVIQTVVWFI